MVDHSFGLYQKVGPASFLLKNFYWNIKYI